jgi:hypothetical protein
MEIKKARRVRGAVESKIKSAAGFLLRLVNPGVFVRHA